MNKKILFLSIILIMFSSVSADYIVTSKLATFDGFFDFLNSSSTINASKIYAHFINSSGWVNASEVFVYDEHNHDIRLTRLGHSMLRIEDNAIIENTNLTITASSGTAYATLLNEDYPGSYINYIVNNSWYRIPDAQSVALTAGTWTSPQKNYIYLDEDETLKASTSYPTGEFAWAGIINVHNVTGDYVSYTAAQDKVPSGYELIKRSYETDWYAGVIYQSGIDITHTGEDLATTAGKLRFGSTEVDFKARDTTAGAKFVWVNDPDGAYSVHNSLDTINKYETGETIGNNKYFNVIIWGSVEDEHNDFYYINVQDKPTSEYSTLSTAEADIRKKTDYDIPSPFERTGFLISRVVLKHIGTDNNEIQTLSIGSNYYDLRNANKIAWGGSGATSIGLDGVLQNSPFAYRDINSTANINASTFYGHAVNITNSINTTHLKAGNIYLDDNKISSSSSISIKPSGDTDNYIRIITSSDQPIIDFWNSNGKITAGWGTIDFDDENIKTTGSLNITLMYGEALNLTDAIFLGSETNYLKFYHDGTDGRISTGTGDLILNPSGNIEVSTNKIKFNNGKGEIYHDGYGFKIYNTVGDLVFNPAGDVDINVNELKNVVGVSSPPNYDLVLNPDKDIDINSNTIKNVGKITIDNIEIDGNDISSATGDIDILSNININNYGINATISNITLMYGKSLNLTNTLIINGADSEANALQVGEGTDKIKMWHDGTDSYIKPSSGKLYIQSPNDIEIQSGIDDTFRVVSLRPYGDAVVWRTDTSQDTYLIVRGNTGKKGIIQCRYENDWQTKHVQIWHDGAHGFIKSRTGYMHIYSDDNIVKIVARGDWNNFIYIDRYSTSIPRIVFVKSGDGVWDIRHDPNLAFKYNDATRMWLDRINGHLYIDGNYYTFTPPIPEKEVLSSLKQIKNKNGKLDKSTLPDELKQTVTIDGKQRIAFSQSDAVMFLIKAVQELSEKIMMLERELNETKALLSKLQG